MSKKNITYPTFGNCPICLEEMIEFKKIHKLKCNHIFHKKCIFDWFEGELIKYDKYSKYSNIPIEGSCPLCRKHCDEIMFSKYEDKCCIIS